MAQHPATFKGISTSSRYLTMRDGVKIAVDLSLPASLKDGERIPAILRQTRYFRSLDIGWPLSWLARPRPNMGEHPEEGVRDARICLGQRRCPWHGRIVRALALSLGS